MWACSYCQVKPQQPPAQTSNVTFVVENKEILVNRGLLEVCSPVLSNKFSDGTDTKPLPGEKHDEMTWLLEQLKPEHIVSIPITGEPP